MAQKQKTKRSVVLYIATSLDGFIARENGEIDWLLEADNGEGDNGYSAFYSSVDTVLLGNATYQQLFELSDEFPYADKKCYVFSRSEQPSSPHVTFVSENIPKFMEQLQQKDGNHIWMVGGADILDLFLKNRLVDEFIITLIPTLLGSGIPLFKPNNPELMLQLERTDQFGQMVQLHYKVKE